MANCWKPVLRATPGMCTRPCHPAGPRRPIRRGVAGPGGYVRVGRTRTNRRNSRGVTTGPARAGGTGSRETDGCTSDRTTEPRPSSGTVRRRVALRRGVAAAVSAALVAAVVVIGCDRPAAPPPVEDDRPTSKAAASDYWPDSAATNPATAPSTRPTPGFAKGRVRAADGKPLDLKDRRAVITVVGSSSNGVERPVSDTVKPDGTYAIKLDPGPYLWPTGMIEFRFNSYQTGCR